LQRTWLLDNNSGGSHSTWLHWRSRLIVVHECGYSLWWLICRRIILRERFVGGKTGFRIRPWAWNDIIGD
jgi:hypothetical protein